MKKIMTIIFVLFCTPALAATYYVRTDGGTTTQCTGLADAAYDGSGSGEACALKGIMWALGPSGGTGPVVGGDTVIIKSGSYPIGYVPGTNPVTGNCDGNGSYTYACTPKTIPSGPSAANPTRILGEGYDTGCANPPELWGTERVGQIFDLTNTSNVEIKCLDLTDHSSCGYFGNSRGAFTGCNRDTYPHGEYAENGITAWGGTSNVLLEDLKIHGFSEEGLHVGGMNNWTARRVYVRGNALAGWDADVGHTNNVSNNTGTIIWDHLSILYSGCAETYPGKAIAYCSGQGDGGYGDGFGSYATEGHWVITDSNFSFNTSDGLDLLYTQRTANTSIKISRSYFEGNVGNAVKSSTGPMTIENSILIGSCDYYGGTNPGVALRAPGATFSNCRAGGDTILAYFPKSSFTLKNSTVLGQGVSLVILGDENCSGTGCTTANSCDGTEQLIMKNNIFMGNYKWSESQNPDNVLWIYNGGDSSGNGNGTCGQGATAYKLTEENYNIIYNTNYGSLGSPIGANDLTSDPKLTNSPLQGMPSNPYLLSNSPARDAADENVTFLYGSDDYNHFPRGASWDIGGLEYGSVPTGGPVPYCGDGNVDAGEQCDGANLNGASCESLGFDLGGTLTCTNCAFVTTECAVSHCGDGIVDSGEDCDDGNKANGDGCSSICVYESPKQVGIGIRGCSMDGVKVGREGQ